MSEVWPLDVKHRLSRSVMDAIRPFKCVLLMPVEGRFNLVAELIEMTVSNVVKGFPGMEKPNINRLDWVTSTGVIQQEIWKEIAEADLIFCDITGYNPNVMFESGVCAAWKELKQVVFIKDHFFKQQSAFDIAPIRYTEYELTSDGIRNFQEKLAKLTQDALIGFPDRQGNSPSIQLPLEIDFKDNQDDFRIYTPPFAHRRVIEGALEFGSSGSFPHSWASIGKEMFLNFSLEFSARFSNPLGENPFIGVGLRSQHYYANYAHMLYLGRKGIIVVTEPNEDPPNFYKDNIIRQDTQIDLSAYHLFRVVFNESILSIQLDDFAHTFQVAEMKKVFGPGLIRFQSSKTWMAINQLKVTNGNPI